MVIGGGFCITFHRRGKATPDYREARAHFRRKQAATPDQPTMGEYVPSEPAAAIDGLTVPRAASADVEGAERSSSDSRRFPGRTSPSCRPADRGGLLPASPGGRTWRRCSAYQHGPPAKGRITAAQVGWPGGAIPPGHPTSEPVYEAQ